MPTTNEIIWTDNDVVNLDDYHYAKVVYIIHDHSVCVCVVLANCLHEAFDIAADAGKLERYAVTLPSEEFPDTEYGENESIARLGNCGEPFDIGDLRVVELPMPKMSLRKLF